jgi:pseudouridine kinase
MDEGHVLVIGSASRDVKGRPNGEIKMGVTNPGRVQKRVGGVARNIAENLARLEVETLLLTAVGRDSSGKHVIKTCEASGIDCTHVRIVAGARTSSHMMILKPDGDLWAGVSDFEVMKSVDADYLESCDALFQDAGMIVIDATLSPAALAKVFEMAARHHIRVCADPTSPDLAGRLCDYIGQLYMVSPNADETTALCGLAAHDYETAINAARHLVSLGTKIAVVTLAERGLAYADGSGGGFIPAIKTRVVDPSGAGDALSGAVIFGLLNDVPIDEAMRLGVTAASLTLQSSLTVLPNLSQELLYEKLAI